jgi:IS5 family transposase
VLQMYPKLLFELNPTLLHKRFLSTDVGEIYQAVPWDELVNLVPPTPYSCSGLGCTPWFDVHGGIALMILKHYLQLSDTKLIERINTDWSLQYFCHIQLKDGEAIADKGIVYSWRNYISKYLDIQKWQYKLAANWKPYMNQTQTSMQDATCYESRIAHPTDVKLLWQSCSEVYEMTQDILKKQNKRKSRANHAQRRKEYLSYQKSKKKTRRLEKKLRKKLIKYLRRLLEQNFTLCQQYNITFSHRLSKRLETIGNIYEQQIKKVAGEQIENRIVSVSKEYIRPIIRGKETKSVEFGAKVNKLQVDGISFIEHLSYDAFNEGTRLQNGIRLHHELFGKCQHFSGDAIYATNKNRTYLKKKGIAHNFPPKGRQKAAHIEQNKLMAALLNKERGTKLEGSFGNEKNHYLLSKVKARTQHTETCWIFFGIHTANAVNIGKRIAEKKASKSNAPPPRELRLAA